MMREWYNNYPRTRETKWTCFDCKSHRRPTIKDECSAAAHHGQVHNYVEKLIPLEWRIRPQAKKRIVAPPLVDDCSMCKKKRPPPNRPPDPNDDSDAATV